MAQCCGVLCFVAIRNLGLPFLLKSIGYSDSKTMMLMSYLSLGAFFQVLFTLIFAGQKIKKLLVSNFVISHLVLGILSGGFLFFSFDPSFLVLGVFLYFLFTAFGDSCWWPFIQPQIPKNKVSTFFTRLRITWATFSFVGILALKYIVEDLDSVKEFGLFIFCVNIIGFSRVFFLLPLNTEDEFSRDTKIKILDIPNLYKRLMKLSEIRFIYFFSLFEPLFFGSVLVLLLNDLGVPKGENFIVQGVGLLSTVVSLLVVNNKLKNKNQKYILVKFKQFFLFLIVILPFCSVVKDIKVIIPFVIVLKFFAGVLSAGAHLIYIKQLFISVDKTNRAISMSLLNLSIFGVFFISEFLFSIFLKLFRSFGGDYFHVLILYSFIAIFVFFIGEKIKKCR